MKDDVRNGQVLFSFHPCVEPLLSRLSFSLVPSLCIPEFKVDTRLAILSCLSLPARFFLRVEQIFFSVRSCCFTLPLSRSLLPSSSSLCPFIVTFLITQTSLAEGRERESSKCECWTTEHTQTHAYTHTNTHPGKNKKMQQHQHHCIDGRRPRLMDSSNKTRHDDFYTKLERVRLSAAASSSSTYKDRKRERERVFHTHTSSVCRSLNFQVVGRDQRNSLAFSSIKILYCALILLRREELCVN